MNDARRYFATCARGLEPVLARELQALDATAIQPGRGGVSFAGDRTLLYRANLWLRTAVRVLVPILESPVESPDDLYETVQLVDWSEFLSPDQTLAVDCNVRDSAITHSHYAALRTKDAICDQFTARVGRRPSVDVQNPMVGLNLHIYKNRMTLSLDSSGDSLHKRGYRPIQTRAPLNEALAAGLIQLTGWTGATPLVDPMCGSGTIPIEASWTALNRPPNLTRKRFTFMTWSDFDIRLWTHLRDEARVQVRKELPASIFGSDVRRDAIMLADKNARAAGVRHLLEFDRKDLCDFHPPLGPAGVILMNPPYGERLGDGEDVKALYPMIAEVVTRRCQGWTVWIFSGNPDLEEVMGLGPSTRIPLYNGRIECRLLEYRLG